MAEKKKSNLLTGEDPESLINMKYCEEIKKQLGRATADELTRATVKKKTAVRKTDKK